MIVKQVITNQKENIHRRAHWIAKYIAKQKKLLGIANLEVFIDYNEDMIIHSVSDNTRYKNLNHFVLLTKMYSDVSKYVESLALHPEKNTS